MRFGLNYMSSMTAQSMHLNEYNSFRMKDNELVKDMYS
jgi:hypothetical protein